MRKTRAMRMRASPWPPTVPPAGLQAEVLTGLIERHRARCLGPAPVAPQPPGSRPPTHRPDRRCRRWPWARCRAPSLAASRREPAMSTGVFKEKLCSSASGRCRRGQSPRIGRCEWDAGRCRFQRPRPREESDLPWVGSRTKNPPAADRVNGVQWDRFQASGLPSSASMDFRSGSDRVGPAADTKAHRPSVCLRAQPSGTAQRLVLVPAEGRVGQLVVGDRQVQAASAAVRAAASIQREAITAAIWHNSQMPQHREALSDCSGHGALRPALAEVVACDVLRRPLAMP